MQDWASTFRKVQAAISHGNRFLLTSRRHIYEAAMRRLGQRNLPMFIDGRAIVDVGDLSPLEKGQILLKGSFLRTAVVSGAEIWSFAHPTIADGLTSILRERPHFIAALLRGATIEAILNSFVCEGMRSIQDAPTIPAALDDVLVARLSRIPDETSTNWTMFRFLADRASDNVFERVMMADDEILRRESWDSYRVSQDPKVLAHTRARRLGRLDEYDQDRAAERLKEAALRDFDLSFFENDDILSLIPPQQVIALGIKLRSETLVEAPSRIANLAEEADLNEDPESHFENYSRCLDILEEFEELDTSTKTLIDEARQVMARAIEDITQRKEAEDKPDHAAEWSYMSPVAREQEVKAVAIIAPARRSIFDDVDR